MILFNESVSNKRGYVGMAVIGSRPTFSTLLCGVAKHRM